MSKDENGNRDSESTAYILGEMRKHGKGWIADKTMTKTECLGLILLQYADRLEEAIKREKRLAQLHCNMMSKALEGHKKKQKHFGNTVAMRESCVNIAGYAQSARCHTDDRHILGYLDQIEKWTKSAIATPARNCDVYAHDEALSVWAAEKEDASNGCFDEWLYKDAAGIKGEGDGGGTC